MLHTRRCFSFLFLSLILGCSARVATQNGKPGRAATPIENALAYNASLADANKGITDVVISAEKAGTLPQMAASNITSVEFTIADADKQITVVLQAVADCQVKAGSNTPAAKNCFANGAQINMLIQRIQANVNSLIGRDLGIKDANTKQRIDTAMDAISKSAGLILTELQTAGILQ